MEWLQVSRVVVDGVGCCGLNLFKVRFWNGIKISCMALYWINYDGMSSFHPNYKYNLYIRYYLVVALNPHPSSYFMNRCTAVSSLR